MDVSRPTARQLLAFYLLLYLVAMTHEAGHLVVGWFACREFVGVSFNVVRWPEGCAGDTPLAHWSAAAGPLVSYAFLMLGSWLALAGRQPALGAALVFANLPFARVFTAAYGGGDEVGLGRALLGGAGRWVALAVVLVLCTVPVVAVASRLPALRRPQVLVAWLVLPMLADFVIRLRGLDAVLARSSAPTWLGVSVVVWLVSGLVLAGWLSLGGRRALSPGASAAGA